jgi:hypothetical protein
VRALLHGAALLMVLAIAACAARGPIIDTGSKPTGVGGTIAGIVRVAVTGQPLSGRKVTAIEVGSGARYETSTATNGGYTIKVPVGRYRLELELRAGETLADQPAVTEINASDLDADRDFVVTVRPSDERSGSRTAPVSTSRVTAAARARRYGPRGEDAWSAAPSTRSGHH